MVSDLAKTAAALVGITLVGAAVAVGWTYLEPIDEPQDEPDEDGLIGTRVFFEQSETWFQTEAHDLPPDGEVQFAPFGVSLMNVTKVVVTLHTEVDGIALNDQYEVSAEAPDGDNEGGIYSGPLVNPDGYRSSVIIIPEWRRAAHPEDTVYETLDTRQALAWSAENHTSNRSMGDWQAQLSVNNPGMPLRSGNVSLSFTFTHYEALATLVGESDVLTECPDQNEGNTSIQEDDCVTPAPEPGTPRDDVITAHGRDASRSFITQTPVAVDVDRDPGPHGPL